MNRILLFSFFAMSVLFVFLILQPTTKKFCYPSKLEIKTLRLNGKSIEPNHEVEVKDLYEINKNDIKATFAYGAIEGEVELPVILMKTPVLLKKDVPVRVDFYVPAKDNEYEGWRGYFNAILK